MTEQEFNSIYYTFTKDKSGIRPGNNINVSGRELKEFVEHAIQSHLEKNNSQIILEF